LFIGIFQLAQGMRHRGARSPQPVVPPDLSLVVMVCAFLSVSTDNLLIFSALLARNGPHVAPWTGAMLVALYFLMGVLGVWAGHKLAGLSVKFRSWAPAITACVGLTTLLA
jgi:ABC-type polysaccharide/polyol phosphate export permease